METPEFEMDAIRTLVVDEHAHRALSWMHDTFMAIRQAAPRRERPTIAFDAATALGIADGDLRWLQRPLHVLTGTCGLAARISRSDVGQSLNGTDAADLAALCRSFDPPKIIDAADFDAQQRDGDRAWTAAPLPTSGPTHAANAVRAQALACAEVVTILPADFVADGDHYTVPVITPGWVALGAMTRFAEVEHHVALGTVSANQIDVAAVFSLDRVLHALEIDRLAVADEIDTFATAARTGRAASWDGPDGVGAAVERFLDLIERRPSLITTIDEYRTDAGLPARGLNAGLDAIEYIADALDLRFAPRIGIDLA